MASTQSLFYRIAWPKFLGPRVHLPWDVKILFFQRVTRLAAFGGSTLVLTLFLSELGNSADAIGIFMTLTLVGDVVISLFTSFIADRVGRKRTLIIGSLLMTSGGLIFAICSDFRILLVGSIFAVISPSGSDVGPFKAIEESAMAQLLHPNDLNAVLAFYYMLGSWGAAAGAAASGWLVDMLQQNAWSAADSYRSVFWLYTVCSIVKVVLSFMLSEKCECPRSTRPVNTEEAHAEEAQTLVIEDKPERPTISRITPPSRWFTLKLCSILILDNVGSGLCSNVWLTYFFDRKFDPPTSALGALFSAANIVASLSNMLAVLIVDRIGIIQTMFSGHFLASVILAMIPVPGAYAGAGFLLLLRSIFLEFDQAPRQTLIARSVQPEERTAVMGIVNLVRTLSQGVGPVFTGRLANIGYLPLAFVLAGGLKVCYDGLLLVLFRHHHVE